MSYFSRVQYIGPPVRWAAGYREHQLLHELFPQQNQGRWLYRQVEASSVPQYFVVSEQMPLATHELWKVQSKSYAPQLSTGQTLAFKLRANPVVTRKTASGKAARHDVVMDAKHQQGNSKDVSQEQLERQAGLAWLLKQGEQHGFAFNEEAVIVSGYQQQRLYKGNNRVPIRFSTLDFDGLLKVTDDEKFLAVLKSGMGKAKGFGCGVLLVRNYYGL